MWTMQIQANYEQKKMNGYCRQASFCEVIFSCWKRVKPSFSQHFASCFSFRVSELKESAEFNNVSLNAFLLHSALKVAILKLYFEWSGQFEKSKEVDMSISLARTVPFPSDTDRSFIPQSPDRHHRLRAYLPPTSLRPSSPQEPHNTGESVNLPNLFRNQNKPTNG